MRRFVTAGLLLALAVAPSAHAQDVSGPAEEGAREQSCAALAASTVGLPDLVAAEPSGPPPASWPQAPAGLLPDRVDLRTRTESFNRLYDFATRGGEIYVRLRGTSEWQQLPLPLCFAGRVASLSADDDELVALDGAGRVYTMDNALKDAALFSWSSRWGTPFWLGRGITLPGDVKAWSWSVVSQVEDGNWTDPAGNRTAIGAGKVSHVWGLRDGGRRMTFWDPWLAVDDSYEMCGPHRGRFRAVNLSASGSWVFVIGRRGDLFARLYDFDISGHDPVFFTYSYEDQRGKGDGAPIQLPAAPWIEQPKIRGRITSAISVHKVGRDSLRRILRVEGARDGTTGYWERDVAAPAADGWSFHATGEPLRGRRLRNPRRDTSARGLARGEDRRYRMRTDTTTAELRNFNVYCSPARLRITDGDGTRVVRLHHVDGLRQQARARGLDDVPREQSGAIEASDGTLTPITLEATRDAVTIEPVGWTFKRVR